MGNWQNCKNILCIRPDNMGDLLMSSPAIRALKETFGAKITVLTSSMAAGVARYIDEIDEVIVYDLPWVKSDKEFSPGQLFEITERLRSGNFDAAVIFTVYSQNPLPTAMLPYMAGIPLRLAYCRENPYQLLTDWVPDKEPYDFIHHQVRRDLELVKAVGATTLNEKMELRSAATGASLEEKLADAGVDGQSKWLIMHPGVSEQKRMYPISRWALAGRKIIDQLGYQVLLTGVGSEKGLTDEIAAQIGEGAFSLAGLLTLEEFIGLIRIAPVLVSVNTGTVHLAAAAGTPAIVLYALTNPQHTPWGVPNRVLPFPVDPRLQSRNQVITYVNKYFNDQAVSIPEADDIVKAIIELQREEDTAHTHYEGKVLYTAII